MIEIERATMIAEAARWAAERLTVASSAVVQITPGDATLYRFAVLVPQWEWTSDGGQLMLNDYLVAVLSPGRGSAYPWTPNWMAPGYVAEKWQCDPHTADVLAEFLSRLAEALDDR